jgi:helitron helicase-like protein
MIASQLQLLPSVKQWPLLIRAAVAQFFHHTCKAVLEDLLATKSGGTGILGDVSNYFGVVETNGRGILHLHFLVWLRGNLGSSTLRHGLLNDSDFATRLIHYLESIIMQCINDCFSDDPEAGLP